jgi:transposase InsO family protein
VRKRKKAKRGAERQPLQLARGAVNEVWSMDFVSDSLANGAASQVPDIVADDFSHECVDIVLDFGISGEYVTRLLDRGGALPRLSGGDAHRQRAGVHQPGAHGQWAQGTASSTS